MRSVKKSTEIAQANGHISVAESVDGSAPGDSQAALKLAGIQSPKNSNPALRQERPSTTDVLTSSGRDLDTGART